MDGLVRIFESASDVFTAFPKLLDSNQGVFLGELHGPRCSSDLAIKTLPALSGKGMKFLFLEHYLQKDQHILDEYGRAGDREPVYARHLENLISITGPVSEDWHFDLFKKEVDRILDVVDAAHKNGIKVMALDNVKHARLGLSEARTSLEVNSAWAQNVKNTLGDTGSKYMIIAGQGHSDPVKGVDKLLGIPSVDDDCFDLLGIEKGVLIPSGDLEIDDAVLSDPYFEPPSSDFIFR